MNFLKLPRDNYKHFFVKMNVIPNHSKDEFVEFSDYVFVFSKCIQEGSSTYGKVETELVHENSLPLFQEVVLNSNKIKYIGQDSLHIDDLLEIRKNEGDYDTKYLAVLKEQPDCQYPEKNVLLITRNRGRFGKLDHLPCFKFACEFQLAIDIDKSNQKIEMISKSIDLIQDLKEKQSDAQLTVEEVLNLLRTEKELEDRNINVKDDRLRSLLQKNDM